MISEIDIKDWGHDDLTEHAHNLTLALRDEPYRYADPEELQMWRGMRAELKLVKNQLLRVTQ